MKNFWLRPVFLVFILSLTTTLFAQYPDRYRHYRSIPENNINWQKALKYYASENLDTALHFATMAEEEFLASREWGHFLFINNFRGQLLGEVRKPSEAIEELAQTRGMAIEHIDTLKSAEYAENLFLNARLLTLVNKYKACEIYLRRTVDLLETSGEYPEMEALVAFMSSKLYNKMMRTEEEELYLNKALDAIRNLDSDYGMAVYYYVQGERLNLTQLYLKADFYKAAVRYFESGNHTSDYLYYYSLMKLSQQYSSFQSDFEKAVSYCDRAEQYALENHLSKAKRYGLYFAIGDVYRSFEKYEESLKYLKKAEKLILEVFGHQSFEHLLSSLYLGRLYRYMGDYDQASTCFYKAWAIGKKGWDDHFPHEFTMYGEMCRMYANAGKPDSALYLAQKRLTYDLKKDTFDIHEVPPLANKEKTVRYYNSLVVKLEAYNQLYRQNKDSVLIDYALEHCRHAFGLIDNLNREALEELSGIRNSVRTKAVASYALFFSLEKFKLTGEQQYLNEAIEFADRSQANYLRFLMADRSEKHISKKESALRGGISEFENRLLDDNLPDKEARALNDSLMALKSELVEIVLNADIKQEGTEKKTLDIPSADVHKLTTEMSEKEAVLLYYVMDFRDDSEYFQKADRSEDRKLVAFLLDSKGVSFFSSPFDKEFQSLMKGTLRGLKTGNLFRLKEIGAALSDELLAPFEDRLKEKEHLVIIPDAELADISFESLPYGKDQKWLCEQFSTSYNYSLGLWNRSRAQADPYFKTLSALAPDFSGDKGTIESDNLETTIDSMMAHNPDIMRDGEHLSPLPQARTEVLEIESLFKKEGDKAASIEYKNATKQRFFEMARNTDILHIASHGYSDVNDYRNSGLFFSARKGAENFLRLNEIYELKTDANLVVLSACKTNAGDKVRGEGVLALPRGFMLAGVPNVIASLWKVHDKKTREFMVRFYDSLLAGKSYAEALQEARLTAIKDGDLPIDWAGFVLIGM
jgi:CHAT domain-containing protein/tetratricopeptide (TPR) repeat protein